MNDTIRNYLLSLEHGNYRISDLQRNILMLEGGAQWLEEIIFNGDGNCEKERIGNELAKQSPLFIYKHKKCNCRNFTIRRATNGR